jgi:hypothetical protein
MEMQLVLYEMGTESLNTIRINSVPKAINMIYILVITLNF